MKVFCPFVHYIAPIPGYKRMFAPSKVRLIARKLLRDVV